MEPNVNVTESKNEVDGLKEPTKTKRRISSILKAPRTPLKTIGAENKVCQEETAKQTEKKRNSRRVSFASTDDVHVFIKDCKNSSSLENLLQDLSGTGEETLDSVGIHTGKDGGQRIVGMETLLNAPLHASQHQNKENIFDSGVQNDFCDKTVVFSEEDVDLTHCHTIIVDDEAKETNAPMSGRGNFDFTSAVWGTKTTGFDDSMREEFKSCSTSGKCRIDGSELNYFFASTTHSSSSGTLSGNINIASSATPFTKVPSSATIVDSKHFLARLCAHKSAVDQENQVPAAERKSAHQDESSQQQGHFRNERTTMLVEQENMDLTNSCTAIIPVEGLSERKSFAPSVEQEDIEMTKSQTVVNATRTCQMVNSSHHKAKGFSTLGPDKTVIFSETNQEMEMTDAFTGHLEANQSTQKDERSICLLPATNTISHAAQKEFTERTSSQVEANDWNDNVRPMTLSNPEGMEMPRNQTAVIYSKNCEMAPSLGKLRSVSFMSAPNKTVIFSEVDDDMEMTDAFTRPFEPNSSTQREETSVLSIPATNVISAQKNFSKRTSSHIAPNKTIMFSEEGDDMEMTDAFTRPFELNKNSSTQREETSVQSIPATNAISSLKDFSKRTSSHIAPNKTVMFSEEGDDMEMTDAFTRPFELNKNSSTQREETSVLSIPATNVISAQKNFSKRTSSHIAPNKTIMFSEEGDDMEMTDAFTRPFELNKNSSTQRDEIGVQSIPATNAIPSLKDFSKRTSSHIAPNKTVMFSEEGDDMEMTDAFTRPFELNKNSSTQRDEIGVQSIPATNAISSLKDFSKRTSSHIAPNKTVMFSEEGDDMEMTDAFTRPFELNKNSSTQREETSVQSIPATNAISSLKDFSKRTSSHIAPNKTVMFSEEGDDMEMTDAFTRPFELNKNSSTQREETSVQSIPATNAISSLKDFSKRTSSHIAPNKTVMFSEEGDDMEMTDAFTRPFELNKNSSTQRDETSVQSIPATNAISVRKDFTKRTSGHMAPNNTTMFSQQGDDMEMTDAFTRPGSQTYATVPNGSLCCSPLSNSDDLDRTRTQTAVIGSKNCPSYPTSGELRGTSFLSPSNKTGMFSEVANDMELTDTFTGHIVENSYVHPCRNKTLDRLSMTKKNNECCGTLDAVSSDPDDMKSTGIQTVTDSKYCGTAKPSLSNVRESLSSMLPYSKDLMFCSASYGMQVPTGLTGLDMNIKKFPPSGSGTVENVESPTTNNVTASDEPEATGRAHCKIVDMVITNENGSKYGLKQNSLPFPGNRNVCHGSDSQIVSEDNGIEMIKTLAEHTLKSSHTDGDTAEMAFPSDKATSKEISIQLASGCGYTWEAASSEGMENEDNQNVCLYTRNGEMVNSSTSKMTKCPHPVSRKIKFVSETDYNMAADENAPVPADGMERQVGSSPTNNTVPPPCQPNYQKLAENTGKRDQVGIEGAILVPDDFGEMSCNAPIVNRTVINDEGRSCVINSRNKLTTESCEIGHIGEKTEKHAKSRRMTLVDFQSKLQNIGLMMNERFDIEKGCHTAPIPRLTAPSSPKAKEAAWLPKIHPGIDDHNNGENPCIKPDNLKLDRQTNRTEPFSLSNGKPLTAQLSLCGFLPKLPRRNKSLNLNREDHTGHSDIRVLQRKSEVSVAEKGGGNGEVKNINDETLPEISNEEDLSETVEGNILQDQDPETRVSQAVVDAEPIQNVTQGQKRPFPVDGYECDMPEERKMRSLTISSQEGEPSTNVQWDSYAVDIVRENPASFLTKTLDSTNFSSGTPNQRCEGTFEMGSHRSSQYDIIFDDPLETNFLQKLEDGSITMREFLKFFGISFNIHNPRQSVLPENFETNSAPNSVAVLLEKHINRPKQRVYEEDCQELTEMVEKLKRRMRDQDKSLKTTNEALWEVVKGFSEEELQSFGTMLNERKVYFRKQSKSVSQELKTGLYSKLVHTTRVAQQNLAEKIEDLEELLKHLDECVNGLQAELSSMDCARAEEYSANSETKLTLEVKQQELESLNMALADNERRVCELELEKNNTKSKVGKLQDEAMVLEDQIVVLERLTEWRLLEKTDGRAVFTFLYDSMGLEVQFEKPADNAMTGAETEQKVADIKFQLELDENKSASHARLVHHLLDQFIQNESSWVQRYPTSQHIPVLLHDVSLVVSRCRLLGEEIHHLEKWGSFSLDILEIGCVENQVRIMFSSLKARAKFELTLAVTPSYPFTSLQLINFQNYIGNTKIDHVKEIIAKETLSNNYLSRIVKKIHITLLCDTPSVFSHH